MKKYLFFYCSLFNIVLLSMNRIELTEKKIEPQKDIKLQYDYAQFLYHNKAGSLQDRRKAIALYESLAHQSDDIKIAAAAQYRLARTFCEGKYVSKNYQRAFCYFLLAARFQHEDPIIKARAQWRLGEICLYGLGMDRQEGLALDFLAKAARQDYCEWAKAAASWELGQFYLAQSKVDRAKEYLYQAALQITNKVIGQKAATKYIACLSNQLNATNCRITKAALHWQLAEFYFAKSEIIKEQQEMQQWKIAAQYHLIVAKNQTDNEEVQRKAQAKFKELNQ